MNKETFVKLATAYMAQENYEDEYRDTIYKLAEKYHQERDFLGLPFGTNPIMDTVLTLLGEEFSYFCYDCEGSFDEYNKRITYKDGSHPNVHSFEELYDLQEAGL